MNEDISTVVITAAVTLFALFGTAAVVSFVLYRTAKFRPDAMVVVSVSILTLVAIFAALTGGSDQLATALISLAGVGLGALAGAVRALFRDTEEGTTGESVPRQTFTEEVGDNPSKEDTHGNEPTH